MSSHERGFHNLSDEQIDSINLKPRALKQPSTNEPMEQVRWLVAVMVAAEEALGERSPGRARATLRRALEQAEEMYNS